MSKSAYAAASSVIFCAVLLAMWVDSPAPRRAVQPFIAEEVTKTFDKNGDIVGVDETAFAIRSDGARVFLRRAFNDQAVGIRTVVDPTTRMRTTLDPTTKSKTTYALAASEAATLQSSSSDDCGVKGAERDTILKFNVVLAKKTIDQGAGPISVEDWVAPALDCYALQSIAVRLRKDGSMLRNVKRVVDVAKGEPDERLFEIPSDYVERSPSEVFAERARFEKRNCPECVSRTSRELDEAYQSLQPR